MPGAAFYFSFSMYPVDTSTVPVHGDHGTYGDYRIEMSGCSPVGCSAFMGASNTVAVNVSS